MTIIKKIINLLLATTLTISLVATAFATNDYADGTLVSYTGNGTEAYTVTVPSMLQPGASGTVTLSGTWPSNRIVNVVAQESVTLTNDLTGSNHKTLTVIFPGIKEAGSNTNVKTSTETIKVENISDALFGEWSGKFYYTVCIMTASGNVTDDPNVDKNETLIPVISKDVSGNDLNAKSYEIVGEDKEDLLNMLENTNLITNSANVDALIEVNSDNFDGLAETTFDVSSIAKPGDKIVIIHFDQNTQEWEFISEVIVGEDGTITADFSNFSPIALVVVDDSQNVDDEFNPLVHNNIIPEGGEYRQSGNYYNFNEKFPTNLKNGDNYCYGDYQYTYSTTTQSWRVSLNNGVSQSKTSYGEILEEINSKAVTDITALFSGCKKMTSAPEIPKTVTSIRAAFKECSALIESPAIPDGVTDIGYAFYGCYSLKKAPAIPDSVTDMELTFYVCKSLEDISDFTIPSGVEKMRLTFYCCTKLQDLSGLVIPGTVLDLDETFKDCTSLKYGPIFTDGTQYLSKALIGCTSLTTVSTIPSTAINIDSIFSNCTDLKTYYGSADADGDFSNYIIPNSVTHMDSAFSGCANITHTPWLSENALTLDYTFADCTALTCVTNFPDKVQSLSGTFKNCSSLSYVPDIPNSVTSMSLAFYECKSLKVAPKLSENVVSLGQTFFGTSITVAPEIPNTVTNMGKTFKNCKYLKTAPVIPEGVTAMYETFYGCYNLTGTIVVHANPTNYKDCLYGVDFHSHNVSLAGSSMMLDEIGSTGFNYNPK